MIKVVPVSTAQVELIANTCRRDQLQYHEYQFLNNDQLSAFFVNKTLKLLQNKDSFVLAAVTGDNIIGMIASTKDAFDSDMFEFPCYRITELIVFSDEFKTAHQIVSSLVSGLEEELKAIYRPFYLSLNLNNNTKNIDYIFNSITGLNFYYIHTLLTFYNQNKRFEVKSFYPENNINIRVATPNDAEQVSILAQKSFKYSRFHLDPFLDDTKASNLLGVSAKNSILHGFVDVMFVAEIENRVVGYYSAKKRIIEEFEKTIGDPVISAVDSKYRGSGVFSKLNDHILNWYSDNTDFAELGTYLANYPVHKTWINQGLGLIRGSHQFSKFNE